MGTRYPGCRYMIGGCFFLINGFAHKPGLHPDLLLAKVSLAIMFMFRSIPTKQLLDFRSLQCNRRD